MGQHGSARLSVHSRLAIARRVLEEGWSVTASPEESAAGAPSVLLRHTIVRRSRGRA